MKKRRNLRRTLGYSMNIGGTALFAGTLPTPVKEPMHIISTKGSLFVIPMVAVTGASIAIKQLTKLEPKKFRRRLM